jgi:hypothetical protein
MSDDQLLKKLQSLKDLRHAIDLIRNQDLEKAADSTALKVEGQQAVAQQPLMNPALKHMGVRTDKAPGVVSHMIGIPGAGGQDHHYEVDVNMNHLDSKIPAYSVHKVHSGSGQALESAPKAHKDIGSAVKALVSHAHTGKWEQDG